MDLKNINEEQMKELLIDYIDGNLSGELESFVIKQIEKDEKISSEFNRLQKLIGLMASSTEFEPSADVKNSFQDILSREKARLADSSAITKLRNFNLNFVLKIAAGISILLIGYFIGNYSGGTPDKDELALLRAEIETTKQLVLLSLQQESASQRIKGVTVSQQIESADDEIIGALIFTMNNDENVNVRLAAVNALTNFTSTPKVREALIEALGTQNKPVVQIRLITLMVDLQEKLAVPKFEQIVNDEKILHTVRDEAQVGIFKLM